MPNLGLDCNFFLRHCGNKILIMDDRDSIFLAAITFEDMITRSGQAGF